MEVLKNPRHYGEELKRSIVAEILNTGASVSSIAQLHGITASQIYKWKKVYSSEVNFVPISVIKDKPSPPSPASTLVVKDRRSLITITLNNGSSVAFEGDYDLSDITQLAQGLAS